MSTLNPQTVGFGRLGLLHWKPVDCDLPAYWLEMAVDFDEGRRVLRATIEPYWALQARTREGWDFFSDPVSRSDLVSLIQTYEISMLPDVSPPHEERTIMDRPLSKAATEAAYAAFLEAGKGLKWLPDWTTWREKDGIFGPGGRSVKDVAVFDLISGRLYWDVCQNLDYWLELHAFGRPSATSETVVRAQFFRSFELARGEKVAVSTFISRPIEEMDLPLLVDHFAMSSVPQLASAIREEKSFLRASRENRPPSVDDAFRAANDGRDWLPEALEFVRC